MQNEFNPYEIALSHSTLSLLAKSPIHFKQYYTIPDDDEQDSNSIILGNITDHLLLGSQLPYFILDEGIDLRTKDGKAIKEEAEKSGKQVIKRSQYDIGVSMADAVLLNRTAAHVFKKEAEAINQKRIDWKDERTGIKLKGFIDRVIPSIGRMIELKTSKDASPKWFTRNYFDYGYHRQAALYFDGCKQNNITITDSCCIVVENSPPFNVAVYYITPETLLRGREDYSRLIDTFIRCRDEGLFELSYDAYSPSGIYDINVPTWLK
jgi:hypothetical protein